MLAMFDKTCELCKFHDEQGNEDQSNADQVLLPCEVAKIEYTLNTGNEQNERHKCCGSKRSKIEGLVCERTDLEDGMLASHVVCLNDLTECKYHKRQGLASDKIRFVSLVEHNSVK